MLIYVVLGIVTAISSRNREYYESPINGFMLFIIIVISLGLIIPSLALAVRRLRDVGLKSKAILVLYIFYYAVYLTWMMSFYSSALNSISTIRSMYSGYPDSNMPIAGLSMQGSILILFIFMLLSVIITISAFLPTNMLATHSKNPVLNAIFTEK